MGRYGTNKGVANLALFLASDESTFCARGIQMIDGGLRARLVCVDTRRLAAGFAGREFDRFMLRELPADVDPCGERGEFHSCVYDGPMFKEPIELETGETHEVAPYVWRDLTVVRAHPTVEADLKVRLYNL